MATVVTFVPVLVPVAVLGAAAGGLASGSCPDHGYCAAHGLLSRSRHAVPAAAGAWADFLAEKQCTHCPLDANQRCGQD